MISYFKSYYKVKIISSVWNWQKKKQINHWLSIDSLEIHPYKPRQFFDYLLTVFSTNGAEITGYPIANKQTKKPKNPDIYLMLLLNHFSCVRLCVTPQMAAHQAPLSLGFSRQEHWSGLPFPSPMHESEKWKWRPSVVPMDCSCPGSSIHGIFQARVLEWGAIAFSDIPHSLFKIKIYLKWIVDLNVKCRIIKLQEDNIGEHQGNLRSGCVFLDTISMAWSMKGRMNKLELLKILKLKRAALSKSCQKNEKRIWKAYWKKIFRKQQLT